FRKVELNRKSLQQKMRHSCLLLLLFVVSTNCRYYLDDSNRDYLANLINQERFRDSRQDSYDYDYQRYNNDYTQKRNDFSSTRNKFMNILSDILEARKEENGLHHAASVVEQQHIPSAQEKSNIKKPDVEKHKLLMPGVSPQKPDTYLCYAQKMSDDDQYITKFEPLADMKVAHHMLLFSCDEPFQKDKVWGCREMAPVCKSGMQMIKYAWGKNAPSLEMPKDVAFHVGGKSPVKYLVLQVHYLNVDSFKDGKTKDHSGLIYTTTTQKPSYFAGIYLLAAGWPPIPPHKDKFHMDMECGYKSSKQMKIYPFRFRVHAHKLGAVITAYRVRNGKYTLIGRGDPQRPQAFYKVDNDLDIKDGDDVIGRCTFNSTSRDTVTNIGATHKDEMCNFYIMMFYKADYGDQNPGCMQTTDSFSYPDDSDVTLAEMERKGSMYLHEHSFKEVDGWPKGLKAGQVGQIAGVEVNKDHVIIFHRGGRKWDQNSFDAQNKLASALQEPISDDTLVWLDRHTGEFVKSMGAHLFYMPHGITLDQSGNIWLTDVGAHQVFKLSPEGKVLLVVGERFVPGDDGKHFCKPTDVVVVQETGEFFVSDGYCNQRVVKFDKTGSKMLMEISPKSISHLNPPSMRIVHSLAFDEENNRLYVADRENNRVLVFNSQDGDYVWQIAFKEAVYAVAVNKKDNVLHAVTTNYVDPKKTSGYTYHLKSKSFITTWKPPAGFGRPHDLAVSKDDNEIYVSEIGPNRVIKFASKQAQKTRP
uniref:Peptidylglycine monooxygenase n=2 Tax=Clytia hemisphaerica TaxID=252671 RepID=A0A7M5VDK8_9CNID